MASTFLDGLNSIVQKYIPPTTGNSFVDGLNNIVKSTTAAAHPFYPTPTGAPVVPAKAPIISPYKPVTPLTDPLAANTPLGFAKNTITALPGAFLNKVIQPITHGIGSVALNLANDVGLAPDTLDPEKSNHPAIAKAIFGPDPIQTAGKGFIQQQEASKNAGTNPFLSTPLAVLGSLGEGAGDILNFDMFGGGKQSVENFAKGNVPESFIRFLTKNDTPTIETTLNKIGLDPVNSKVLAEKLGPEKTTQGVKDILINHDIQGTVPYNPKVEPSKLPIPGETPAEALARSEAYATQQHPTNTLIPKPIVPSVDPKVQTVFNVYRSFEKGEIIENPERLVPTGLKVSPDTQKITGISNGDVSFTNQSLKHLAEKGDIGQKIIDKLPEIISTPDTIRQGQSPDRFLISKSYPGLKGERPYTISLEVTEKNGHVIVTGFPGQNSYLENFQVLWKTASPSKKGVLPSQHLSPLDSGGSSGISALTARENLQGTDNSLTSNIVKSQPKVQISEEGIPMARKNVPFLPNKVDSISTRSSTPVSAELPSLPIQTGPREATTTPIQKYSSPQDTTNQINLQVTGDTAKQRIQSAIANSERAKNLLTTTGQGTEYLGNKLSPSDIKLAEKYESGIPVTELVKQAEDPGQFKKFMDKLTNYYDLRLATDRAAGGTTEKVQNYIPHQWDLSKPADLERFNKMAVQKGLQPYNGFHAQPRVFSTYAEGEAAGFKRANKNILEDLKKDYSGASTVISRQALKKGLQEAVPDMVTSRGLGRTVTGKPFVNSNVAGLEGLAYDPYVHKQLKGFQPRTDQNLFKTIQDSNAKTPKEIWQAVKDTGAVDTASSLYDKGNKSLKTLILNLSGFHSINISGSYLGHALFTDPLRGATGLLKSIAATFSEDYTQKLIEQYKKEIVPGTGKSVFDWGLESGVNMGRSLNPTGAAKFNPLKVTSHMIFDRELHVLKMETIRAAAKGVDPQSAKGRDIAKEINMLMGEMNNHTQNINPNTIKWLDRTLLAPSFTASKFKIAGDSAFKWGKNTSGNFARKAVIGKSIIIGLIATFGTLLATGKFPNLHQTLLNFTIDPGTQTNMTNPKSQKLDIKYPKSFVSEIAGLGVDPKQYLMNRLAPGLSTAMKVGFPPGSGTDQYGNPIVDVNKKESVPLQYAKNLGTGLLPIGAQAGANLVQGKISKAQAITNVVGLQTKTSASDPTVLKYKGIDDAKGAINKIAPEDPKRTDKIQAIYNDLTPDQRKSLNYQLLLNGVSTKGVLSSDAGKMKPLYDQLQAMKADGKTTEANAIWSKLSADDKKLYAKVKTYYKRTGTTQGEKDFQTTFQTIRDMKTSGDPALEVQADDQYNALSASEKHIYQLLKKQNI